MHLDVARVGEEGGDAGGEELLAVAAADDQRALLAGADEHAGLVGGDGDERVVAAQAVVGAPDGLDEAVARRGRAAIRWAITSTSVSDVNSAPSARSSCLSSM